MEVLFSLTNQATGEDLGVVFFDDGWDAYGWKTAGFTNGPYDTPEEALDYLKAELGGVPLRVTAA